MPIDTFIVYVGVYPDVYAAEADYERVKDLHVEAQLMDEMIRLRAQRGDL